MVSGLTAKKAVERFKGFVSRLTPFDRVLVLFHGDTDGLCSAVITSRALERLRGRPADLAQPLSYEERTISEEAFKLVKEKKINKVIILDWNVDQDPESVKRLEKKAELLLIDHHKIYRDLNSKRTVFIKAHYLSRKPPSRYPASKMAFDLFSKVVEIDDLDWLALTGVIGDASLSAWKPFAKKTLAKHRWGKKAENSKPDKVSQLITGLEALKKEKLAEAFDRLVKAKKPDEILKSPLKRYAETLDKEIEKWFKQAPKKAEFYPELELVYYAVKSKHYIKSPLINKMSFELYPRQTVIVVLDQGKPLVKVSARRQDMKVRMNDLLEQAVKDFEKSSGGGHIPAAAGILPRKYLKKFKSNILMLLESGKFKSD